LNIERIEKNDMNLNRREFVILTCAVVGGCAAENRAENAPIALRTVSIDAGPVSGYSTDGVYDRFRAQGFFVIRRGSQLIAMSSNCTHRACRLNAEPDRSFYCKCHGSTFDPAGKVTEGPATRDLPTLPTTIDASGRLIVTAVTR
jgi:Rieske Fe-S protein